MNTHGVSGFLSEVGAVEEMAKNALVILKSDAELAQFKKQARTQAQHFAIENIVPMYEEVYEKAIRKNEPKKASLS